MALSSPSSAADQAGAFIDAVIALLGAATVLTDRDAMLRYELGLLGQLSHALCVLRPGTTEEVSAIVRLAYRHRVPLVAQGANTGLTGSGNPDPSGRQAILSLERMNRIVDVDALNRSAEVEAGVRLSQLNDHLASSGFMFPVDVGSNPSVGGMVATNIAGARVIRYGDLRHNLLGIEVVLADEEGSILELGGTLRKNNSGLDLKQIFVGTGGAFGIVTRAILEVQPLPASVINMMVVPASYADVATILSRLERTFGDCLCAFEGLSSNAIAVALESSRKLNAPFGADGIPSYALLIELASTRPGGVALHQEICDVLADLTAQGVIDTVYFDDAQRLWALRDGVVEALMSRDPLLMCDVAMPRSALGEFHSMLAAHVHAHFPDCLVCDFGHCGDGGEHIVVLPRDPQNAPGPGKILALQRWIYETVVSGCRGTFSAEHGIGPLNQAYYRLYTPESVRRLSGMLQAIVNPGKLLGRIHLE